jgi:hypothetical protein
MKALIVKWLFNAMMSWVVIYPTKLESREAAEARRQLLAEDYYEVAFDPAEEPLFKGPNGRAQTALFLSSIAGFEGAYSLKVQNGTTRGKLGEVCLMQVMVHGGKTEEGWTVADLITDNRKCVRVALHILRKSQSICGDAKSNNNESHIALTGADLYGIYTSGKCFKGNFAAFQRLERPKKWMIEHPVPLAGDQ